MLAKNPRKRATAVTFLAVHVTSVRTLFERLEARCSNTVIPRVEYWRLEKQPVVGGSKGRGI